MQHPPFRRGARALLFFTFLSFLFVAAGHAQKPTTSTPTIISCPNTLQVTGLMHAAQLPGGWSAIGTGDTITQAWAFASNQTKINGNKITCTYTYGGQVLRITAKGAGASCAPGSANGVQELVCK